MATDHNVESCLVWAADRNQILREQEATYLPVKQNIRTENGEAVVMIIDFVA